MQSPAIHLRLLTQNVKRRRSGLPFPSVAIMGVQHQTDGEQQTGIYYAHTPVPNSVEENFEVFFQGHDDSSLAELLQDQETVYQSLQRNAPNDTTRSSNTTRREGHHDRRRNHGNSSQTLNAEALLAVDEAYARELQELEDQLSYTSFDDETSVVGLSTSSGRGNTADNARTQLSTSSGQGNTAGNARTQPSTSSGRENTAGNARTQPSTSSGRGNTVGNATTQPSTSSGRGNTAGNATTQISIEDDVDADNMTYEELQSLGEAIGTTSKGLSDELISHLPVSRCKVGLFQRKENRAECVICCMTYKNKDELITLPCQHQYHKVCVTKWLKIDKACPVCKKIVFER